MFMRIEKLEENLQSHLLNFTCMQQFKMLGHGIHQYIKKGYI